MFNSFSSRMGLRYLWSKSGEPFLQVIRIISVLGVAIGVIVLNVVMAVMTGFQFELRDKFLGNSSHVLVQSFSGQIADWRAVEDILRATPDVQAVSPFTYHQALIRKDNRSAGIFVRGLEAGSEAEGRLLGRLAQGRGLAEGFDQISASEKIDSEKAASEETADTHVPGLVIGGKLQDRLQLAVGDFVSLLSPQVGSSPFGLVPKYRRFQVVGVYRSGLTEYENVIAYTDLPSAQKFFRFGDSISGFEVQGKNPDHAPALSAALLQQLGSQTQLLYTQDWTESNRALWEALRLEKFVYFLVLLLIILMASFSIVATLILLVLQKRKDIAVLRTLGASKKQVSKIFHFQGSCIGALGTLLGVLGSYLACAALKAYRFPLDSEVFPVSELPLRLEHTNVIITAAVAFFICSLVTIYPARRAAQVDPASVLRYE